MKRSKTLLFGLALCLTLVPVSILTASAPDKTYAATEAKDHISEKATVCGTVASTRYAPQSKGSPTFVNLDKPYPNQIFTIVIWGEDLSKFDKPSTWEGKRVCATGTITSYRSTPEIVASSPSQVTFPGSSLRPLPLKPTRQSPAAVLAAP